MSEKKAYSFLLPSPGPQPHTICRAGATLYSSVNYEESDFKVWWGSFTQNRISWGSRSSSGSGWGVKPCSPWVPTLALVSRRSSNVWPMAGRGCSMCGSSLHSGWAPSQAISVEAHHKTTLCLQLNAWALLSLCWLLIWLGAYRTSKSRFMVGACS